MFESPFAQNRLCETIDALEASQPMPTPLPGESVIVYAMMLYSTVAVALYRSTAPYWHQFPTTVLCLKTALDWLISTPQPNPLPPSRSPAPFDTMRLSSIRGLELRT